MYSISNCELYKGKFSVRLLPIQKQGTEFQCRIINTTDVKPIYRVAQVFLKKKSHSKRARTFLNMR